MSYVGYVLDDALGFSVCPEGTPGAAKRRIYEFKIDPSIPVLIIFVVRVLPNREPELLLLRRAFTMKFAPGAWTVLAGIDAHLEEGEPGRILAVDEELQGEAGIMMGSRRDLFFQGGYQEPRGGNTDLEWDKTIVVTRADVKTVTLNWENVGSCWIPVSLLRRMISEVTIDDPVALALQRDGFTPDFRKNADILFAFLESAEGQRMLQ